MVLVGFQVVLFMNGACRVLNGFSLSSKLSEGNFRQVVGLLCPIIGCHCKSGV